MILVGLMIKATVKQKAALKHIIEDGDDVTHAMVKAGYSVTTAHTPSKLTNSEGFISLIEAAGITDDKLALRLNEGLDATRTIVMGKDSNEAFVDIQPDYPERRKNVELSLKLKGHLNDKPQTNTVIIPIYGGLSSSVSGHDSNPENIQSQ